MAHHRIEMRSYRFVGGAMLALSGLGSLLALADGERQAALGLAIAALVGLYQLFAAGFFVIDEQGIAHQSAFGRWRILWREVGYVEIGAADGSMVFHAGEKQFVLSPPQWWPNDARANALEYLYAQIEAHKLPMRQTRSAAFKVMRGTRVTA